MELKGPRRLLGVLTELLDQGTLNGGTADELKEVVAEICGMGDQEVRLLSYARQPACTRFARVQPVLCSLYARAGSDETQWALK